MVRTRARIISKMAWIRESEQCLSGFGSRPTSSQFLAASAFGAPTTGPLNVVPALRVPHLGVGGVGVGAAVTALIENGSAAMKKRQQLTTAAATLPVKSPQRIAVARDFLHRRLSDSGWAGENLRVFMRPPSESHHDSRHLGY